jgi:zinc transport system substrate-binding protein
MFRSRRVAACALAGAALLAAGLAGCGDDGSTAAADGRLTVEASFYPLAWISEQVGGDHVAVRSLTAPGAEPHDLELTPRAVAAVLDADLVVYLHGLQPSVDDAVAQIGSAQRFDAAQAGAHLDLTASGSEAQEGADGAAGPDPHFWLDPTRLADVATALVERLSTADPAHADDYGANGRRLTGRLAELDRSFQHGLASCPNRDIVTSHSAFGYLARRYGLRQLGITGLTPEAEPSPADLAAVTRFVRDHHVGTIFFESLVSPAVAKTVARETGAATAVLDPIEGITKGSKGHDYLEVMASDLAALRTALGCP